MCKRFKCGKNPNLRLRTTAAIPVVLGACMAPGLTASVQAAPPDEITLIAVVRDFVEREEPDGHPDFERNKDLEADGLMIDVVRPSIGDDGKPVLKSAGTTVDRHNKFKYMQWKDSAGRSRSARRVTTCPSGLT